MLSLVQDRKKRAVGLWLVPAEAEGPVRDSRDASAARILRRPLMFFDGWMGLLRVLVAGTLAYTALLLLLRVSGKRTLSKLNAFDFIITVALGSTLATVVISKDVALLEGVLAFALLVFAQYAVTALSVRFAAVRRVVKAQPRLLAYRGELIREALWEERLTVDEVAAVLRGQGYAGVGETGAVVLETDGSVSVLPPDAASGRALDPVAGVPGGDPGPRSGDPDTADERSRQGST